MSEDEDEDDDNDFVTGDEEDDDADTDVPMEGNADMDPAKYMTGFNNCGLFLCSQQYVATFPPNRISSA
jgi:hypothetical protein